MKKTKQPKQRAAKPTYQPTSQEQAALGRFCARSTGEPAPRLKVENSDQLPSISPDHPDDAVGLALIMEALGTDNTDFAYGLVRQLANAGSRGPKIDENGLNFMLAVVRGVKPRDQVEAMLAAQMAAIHETTMTFARRLAHVETLPQQDSAERALNKLARTFAMQVEALKRYRTGGEQKVTVQHVSVNEGGQAIVGNVNHAPRATAPDRQADRPPALIDARTPAMPIIGESEPVLVPPRRRRKDGSST
jgi:hypothetical protein